jgi:hypothetical protein
MRPIPTTRATPTGTRPTPGAVSTPSSLERVLGWPAERLHVMESERFLGYPEGEFVAAVS